MLYWILIFLFMGVVVLFLGIYRAVGTTSQAASEPVPDDPSDEKPAPTSPKGMGVDAGAIPAKPQETQGIPTKKAPSTLGALFGWLKGD